MISVQFFVSKQLCLFYLQPGDIPLSWVKQSDGDVYTLKSWIIIMVCFYCSDYGIIKILGLAKYFKFFSGANE